MPASICSNFSIILENTTLNAGALQGVTLTNPGRPFRVVSVEVEGDVGADAAVFNVATGNAISLGPAIPANYLSSFPQTLQVSTLDVAATEDIGIVEQASVDLFYVQIICEATNPEQLAVTLIVTP
jgi:hypothetical protein